MSEFFHIIPRGFPQKKSGHNLKWSTYAVGLVYVSQVNLILSSSPYEGLSSSMGLSGDRGGPEGGAEGEPGG